MEIYAKKRRTRIVFAIVFTVLGAIFFKTGCIFMGVFMVLLLALLFYVSCVHRQWYKAYRNTKRQVAGMSLDDKYLVIRQNDAAWATFASDEEITMLCREFFQIRTELHSKEELRDIFLKYISEKVSLRS